MGKTTITTQVGRCTASHDGILVGYAGGSDAPGSFGAFIAEQPVGAWLLSMSGWICRWTGEYVDAAGHRAAVLERVGHVDRRSVVPGGKPKIHTCLNNVWSATGDYTFDDGAAITVKYRDQKLTALCTVHGHVGESHPFGDPAARNAAFADAAAHARTHA